jgi:hypothetical protein
VKCSNFNQDLLCLCSYYLAAMQTRAHALHYCSQPGVACGNAICVFSLHCPTHMQTAHSLLLLLLGMGTLVDPSAPAPPSLQPQR